jgi:hypothetical protein
VFNNLQQWVQQRKEEDCLCSTLFLCSKHRNFCFVLFPFLFVFFFSSLFVNCLMGVYSSIWNADDWATQGGRVKTDWTHAPFVTTYERFERGDGKDLLGSSFPLMSTSAKLQTCCEETRIRAGLDALHGTAFMHADRRRRGGSTLCWGSVVCVESRVVFRCMWVRGAKQVDHIKRITWKSRDFTFVIELERRPMEYPTLNGFDKFIHSIERFATLVPLSKKAL